MRRLPHIAVMLALLTTVLVGCGQTAPPSAATGEQSTAATADSSAGSTDAPAASGPVKTLRLVTLNSQMAETLKEYARQLEQKMPGYTVEITVVPGVAEFNAAMAAKLASGDPPDIMVYQWGSQIQLFAKGDHLMDSSGHDFLDRLKPIKKKMNVYNGKVYAAPIAQSAFGVYFN